MAPRTGTPTGIRTPVHKSGSMKSHSNSRMSKSSVPTYRYRFSVACAFAQSSDTRVACQSSPINYRHSKETPPACTVSGVDISAQGVMCGFQRRTARGSGAPPRREGCYSFARLRGVDQVSGCWHLTLNTGVDSLIHRHMPVH